MRFASETVQPVHDAPLIQIMGGPVVAAKAFSTGPSVPACPKAAADPAQ
jgi:hypothetical protein